MPAATGSRETPSGGLRPGATRDLALALAAALAAYAALAARFAFVCDDAYISFRYARHLAQGLGLRFNAGEAPPVEGYSNLLWTLAIAAAERAGIAPELASNALSASAGALLVALATRLAQRRLALGRAATAATALFLATLPPVALWATGGLETMAFALAVFLAFERLELDPGRPRALQAGLAAAAAALLRVDGAAWAALAIGAAAADRARLADRAWRRALLVSLAPLAAAVLAQLAFRVGYHGDWLPNTARVKGGLSALRLERGARYLGVLLLSAPSLALAAALAPLGWRGPSRPLAARAAAPVAAAAAYAVFVGGDFMPFGRFLVVAAPFLALAFAASLAALARRPAVAATVAALAVASSALACFDLAVAPRAWREALHFRWNDPAYRSEVEQWRAMRGRAREWSDVGRALARLERPGESIVLAAIGAIGYRCELVVHDRFGLVDREVARRAAPHARASPGHDRGVGIEFFLARRPTYLGAWIAPASARPEDGLPPGWQRSPLAAVSVVESHALDPELGLAPGQVLRVLRYRPER